MSMRSYKAQISLLTIVLLLAVIPTAAQEAQYNAGAAAEKKGDAIGARDGYCAAGDFKDAKQKCAENQTEAKKAEARYNQNYVDGVQLMQEGKYAEAEFKFRNVKYGPRLADAQGQLLIAQQKKREKEQADAAAAQNANVENAAKQKFDDGVARFGSNDFGGAKASFEQVTGSRQGDAQGYISRINAYNTAMATARGYENAKDYKAASASFAEAARIKADGPGDPLNQVTRVATLAGQAPVPTNQNTQQQEVKATREAKPIDVAQYMATARRLMARNDFKGAARYFGEVWARDKNNQEAKALLDEANSKDTTEAKATDADPVLADAINAYYGGDLRGAEYRLDSYIYDRKVRKPGLGNFFRGAVYLQQYFLSGERDQNAYQEALKRFKAAKAVQGFVPPEKYVSPRIMKVYKEAAGS